MQKNVFIILITSFCTFLFSCTTTITGLGIKNNLKAEFNIPNGNGPFPAVVVLHPSNGVTDANLDYARMLTGKGYASIVPHYFEAHKINEASRGTALTTHAEEILADLVDVLENLKTNPKIDKNKLGAVGFSMGGYWAMVLAAKGYVQAGVSYYGVLSGVGNPNNMKYKFADIFNARSSPVLILHGENDTTQPVIGAHRLSAILERKNLPYEKQIYPYAGHHFDSGKDQYSAMAVDSWNRTLVFFDKYLQKRSSLKVQ